MAGVETGAVNPTCELEKAFSDKLVENDQQLIDFACKYIGSQIDAMYEELGDEFNEDPSVVEHIASDLGLEMTDKRLHVVGSATVRCLQNRYLGNCALTTCKGRDRVDNLISQALCNG